jgi:hypothetical protein
MTDTVSIYDVMPKAQKINVLSFPIIWFKSLREPKIASDLIQLLIKSLPVLAVIVVSLSLPIILFFWKAILANYKESPTLFWIVVTTAFTLVAIYSLNSTYNRWLSNRLIELDIHSDFKILQHVFITDVLSPTEVNYAYRYLVRSKKDGVREFPILYNWSGRGNIEIVPRNANFKAEISPHPIGHFAKSILHLGQSIQKGHEFLIEYQIKTNSEPQSPPAAHVVMSVFCRKYPRFNTFLIVRFCELATPIAIYRQYYFGNFTLRPIKSILVNLDDNLKHVWNVRGLLNWAYCIKWDIGA